MSNQQGLQGEQTGSSDSLEPGARTLLGHPRTHSQATLHDLEKMIRVPP